MWVVLLIALPAPVSVIIKLGLEKTRKFISINIMFIKNNFVVTSTLKDKMGWRAGRSLSLTGLRMF